MPEIKGDMTQDEVDEQLKSELAARIGSATDTNPVRLTGAEASRLLELLGGPPKPKAQSSTTQSAASRSTADDDDDDEPSTPSSRASAAKRK